MSLITTDAELLDILSDFADDYVNVPEQFSHLDPSRFQASIVQVNSERTSIQVSGVIEGWHTSVVLAFDFDGGVTIYLHGLQGASGYKTTLLPEDSTRQRIVRHLDRAVANHRNQLVAHRDKIAARRLAEANA